MLNKSAESGCPCFVPDLGGQALCLSPLIFTLIRLVIDVFYQREEVPFSSYSQSLFIMKVCGSFLHQFDNCELLSFVLLI